MYQATSNETQADAKADISPFPTFQSQVSTGDEQWDVQLVNSRKMAAMYPDSFQRHPIEKLSPIPEGMFVKVICIWPIEVLPNERFWVEITEAREIDSGVYQYFGLLRNRTLLADFGERIGPMPSECFCDIDMEKFVEERLQQIPNKQSACDHRDETQLI